MATDDPKAPTRQELAEIFKSPRLVRAFEQLFGLVPSEFNEHEALIEETTIQAGNATAQANAALATITRLADAVELLAGAPSFDPLVSEIRALREAVELLPASVSTPQDFLTPAFDLAALAELYSPPVNVGTLGVQNDDRITCTGFERFVSQATVPDAPPAGSVNLFAMAAASGVARLQMRTSTGAVLTFFRDDVNTIRNNTGSTINKGQVVYINGANGTTPTAALAKADAASTSEAYGFALANISNNSFGTVQTRGSFTGLDTTAFSQGDTLWLSASSAGGVTNAEPAANNYGMKLGKVVTSSANGQIDIFIQPFVPSRNFASIGRIGRTGGVDIEGTNTNDAAAAGDVGEYVESVVAAVNAPATATWGDLTSVALTAGDWDVCLHALTDRNGATMTGPTGFGIGTAAGNDSAGLVHGDTRVESPTIPTATQLAYASIPYKRVSLSASATIYLKMFAQYSAGTPQCYGRLSARRRR